MILSWLFACVISFYFHYCTFSGSDVLASFCKGTIGAADFCFGCLPLSCLSFSRPVFVYGAKPTRQRASFINLNITSLVFNHLHAWFLICNGDLVQLLVCSLHLWRAWQLLKAVHWKHRRWSQADIWDRWGHQWLRGVKNCVHSLEIY